MKRTVIAQTFATSLLTLLLAAPAWAESEMPESYRPPRTWLATEHDVRHLNEKIAQTESTLTQRIAKTESTLTARLASTEKVLKETEQDLQDKVSALEREIKDLRAGAESKERQARQPQGDRQLNGEKKALPPSGAREQPMGKNGVNDLTGRVAEIEKSLAGTVAKIHDLRGRIQDLRARAEAAEAKEHQARVAGR